MTTLIQEVDKKDINIIRNAVRYVLYEDMGINGESLKDISLPIIEERLNHKLNNVIKKHVDNVPKLIEYLVLQKIKESSVNRFVHLLNRKILEKDIEELVNSINVEFSINGEKQDKDIYYPATLEQITPIEIRIHILGFDIIVTSTNLNSCILVAGENLRKTKIEYQKHNKPFPNIPLLEYDVSNYIYFKL